MRVPLHRLAPLALLTAGAAAVQDAPLLLRNRAESGGALVLDADLVMELGVTGTEGSLRLERRTVLRELFTESGAVERRFERLLLRTETPFVTRDTAYAGRGRLEGRAVRFVPPSTEEVPTEDPARPWTVSFADGDEQRPDEWLADLRLETGLADLVPGRAVAVGATYEVAPRALARVLALGGGYVYEAGTKDGSYPFRVDRAEGDPLRARLASVRAVGDEHVAVIDLRGTLTVLAAFQGPGPLWRLGLTSTSRVPRRARLALEVTGRLEWWVEAGHASSLELEGDLEIVEELTRIGTICEDIGLPPPEREIPFDPDEHLLYAKEPEKAPREGTLKLRLRVDC